MGGIFAGAQLVIIFNFLNGGAVAVEEFAFPVKLTIELIGDNEL